MVNGAERETETGTGAKTGNEKEKDKAALPAEAFGEGGEVPMGNFSLGLLTENLSFI